MPIVATSWNERFRLAGQYAAVAWGILRRGRVVVRSDGVWTSVGERLPGPGTQDKWFWIYTPDDDYVGAVQYDPGTPSAPWYDAMGVVLGVTHWQPLPTPPPRPAGRAGE